MNIIDKLKSLGVEVTEEIEKAFPGEFVSALEVEKKTEKINVLELPYIQAEQQRLGVTVVSG